MSTLAFSSQETSMIGRKSEINLKRPNHTTITKNKDESYEGKNTIHINVVKTTSNINMFKKAEKEERKFKNVKKFCATKKKGLRIREFGEDFPIVSVKSDGKLVYICRLCHENFMSMGHIYFHLKRHSQSAWKTFYKLVARRSTQIVKQSGNEDHDRDVKVVALMKKFLFKWEMKKGKRSSRLRPRDAVDLNKANNVENARGRCWGSKAVDAFVNDRLERAVDGLMMLATNQDYMQREVEDLEVDEEDIQGAAEGLMLMATDQDYKPVLKTSMTRRKVEVDEDMIEVAESLLLLSRVVEESNLRVEDVMITSGGGCKMIHDFDLNEEPSMECD